MNNKLYPSDLYYNQGESAKKVTEFINSLMLWENDACQLVITPTTKNVTVAIANAGTTIPVKLSIKSTESTPTVISFAEFVLAASVGENISDETITPSISTETPTLLGGETSMNIILPAVEGEATYVAGETVTLTIAKYTAKDGREVSGGTCVVTITE